MTGIRAGKPSVMGVASRPASAAAAIAMVIGSLVGGGIVAAQDPPTVSDHASGGTFPLESGCGPTVARCQDLPPGTHVTAGASAFLTGLSVTLPSGWSSLEQDSAEFELHRVADDGRFNEILFWQAMRPWVGGYPLLEPGSVDELLRSLRTDERLVTTAGLGRSFHRRSADGRANDTITAPSLTVTLPDDAVSEFADCPFAACVDFIGNPAWGHGAGLFEGWAPTATETEALVAAGSLPAGTVCPCANGFRLFLLAHPAAAGPDHVVIVALAATGAEPALALDAWEHEVAPILDSVVFP